MARVGLSGRPYVRLRAWVMATYSDCYRCGGPVDKTLPGRHPWGPSLEHKVPRSKGGDPLSRDNAALSHLHCNVAYRDGRRIRVRTTQSARTLGRYAPSRQW